MLGKAGKLSIQFTPALLTTPGHLIVAVTAEPEQPLTGTSLLPFLLPQLKPQPWASDHCNWTSKRALGASVSPGLKVHPNVYGPQSFLWRAFKITFGCVLGLDPRAGKQDSIPWWF